MVDSAIFYLIGTFYPLLARATYPALGFGSIRARSPRPTPTTTRRRRPRRTPRRRSPSRSRRSAALPRGPQFVGGEHPSIADIRWSATLEFLHSIDYDFPRWTTEYMAAVEEALGDAYSEPAGDVRGYIESVKSPA